MNRDDTLSELKTAILNLANEGEELHEGPMLDLARIMRRIIHNYEHKGIQYVVDTYWERERAAEEQLKRLSKLYRRWAESSRNVGESQDRFERACSKIL